MLLNQLFYPTTYPVDFKTKTTKESLQIIYFNTVDKSFLICSENKKYSKLFKPLFKTHNKSEFKNFYNFIEDKISTNRYNSLTFNDLKSIYISFKLYNKTF